MATQRRKQTSGSRKRTGQKKSTARSTARKPQTAARSVNPVMRRRITGIIMAVLGLYVLYAFSTPTPGILDKIVGKILFAFFFGNTTFMIALFLFAAGILVFLGRLREKLGIMLPVFLLIVNLMVIFSMGINGLLDYSVLDLFTLAFYGGKGGIIGNLLAYFLELMITSIGTTVLLLLSSCLYIILIVRAAFPEFYQTTKKRALDALPDGNALKARFSKKGDAGQPEAEAEDAGADDSGFTLKAYTDPDDLPEGSGFFERSDTGKVSIDTEILDFIDDVNRELDGDQPEADDVADATAVYEPVREPQERPEDTKVITDEFYDLGKHAAAATTAETAAEPVAEPYRFPPTSILNASVHSKKNKRSDVMKKAKCIEETLSNFGVKAKIIGVDMGPSITRFELQPAAGVKVNKIVNLSDDLALSLATSDIRIEAPIPGKAAVGIEVPNEESEIVGIRDIIESAAFQHPRGPLPVALGKTLSGQNIIGDISKMPHVLIAGATGSGKSVCINTIIISLLYAAGPEELKFIMIDPKMVELNQYNAIPHMLIPVVTDPKKAAYALNWGIKEMTDRYQLFKENGVREIDAYNAKMQAEGGRKLPRIVIVVDELADLMMTSPKEVEGAICRIAQLARACGIHLIIATQRPSVDVITGLIKANIPSRIAFSVASSTDSRTILDVGGAEKLLGKGDMLYFPVGKSKPLRVQGTFVSDAEIKAVIDAVRPAKAPVYNERIQEVIEEAQDSSAETEEDSDPLLEQAVDIAFTYNQISTSMLQRKCRVGYARAGRLIDMMEQRGIISGPNGSKPRTLLMTREEYEQRR